LPGLSLPLSSPAALDRAVRLPCLVGRYSASYEFTTLIAGQALALYNHIDGSILYSLYATWSLTDNAEMAFSVSSASGSADAYPVAFDEFALCPAALSIEFRAYF